MMLCNTLFLCAVSLSCTVLYCTVNCVALYWTELCSTLHRNLIQNFCVLKLPIINAYFIRTKNCQCSRHRDNRGLIQNGAASAVHFIAVLYLSLRLLHRGRLHSSLSHPCMSLHCSPPLHISTSFSISTSISASYIPTYICS